MGVKNQVIKITIWEFTSLQESCRVGLGMIITRATCGAIEFAILDSFPASDR